MANVLCLHVIIQEEDILSILMPSVHCAHFSELVDHCVT